MNYFKVRLEKMKKRKLLTSFIVIASASILALGTYAVNASGYFSDVKDSDWYHDEVEYVYESGLMNGTSDETFAPDGNVSRAMIVTILWRLEKEPAFTNNAFDDVAIGKYYSAAIAWANANNIVTGYGDGNFGPNDSITREQLAVILYRYASFKGYNVTDQIDISSYKDTTSISSYAKTAFSWAVSNGFITGMPNMTLNPIGYTSRGQAAAVLQRFCESDLVRASDAETETTPPQEKQPEKDTTTSENAGVNVAVDGSPMIYIDDVVVQAGETEVDVPVLVKNNPGILGMLISVNYNDNLMEMTSADCGSAVKDILSFMPAKNLAPNCNFVWYGTKLSADDIQDGILLSLHFSIKDNTAVGKYPITIFFKDENMIDTNLQTLKIKAQNGNLIIE